MKEIKTLDAFRDFMKGGIGYLMITDFPRKKNIIHKPACSHLRQEDFNEKVVKGACETGNYYLLDDMEGVAGTHNAELCRKCFEEESSGA